LLSSSEQEITFDALLARYTTSLPEAPGSLQTEKHTENILTKMFQCLEISLYLDAELRKHSLFEVYISQELHIAPILATMELIGVPLDTKEVPSFQLELTNLCDSLSSQASIFFLSFGGLFSQMTLILGLIKGARGVMLSSPKQVADALFK
jgi:DNA polymerase I-like protein with 3'-5' exonuclease and polymerase domains